MVKYHPFIGPYHNIWYVLINNRYMLTPRLGDRALFPFESHDASKWPRKLLSEKSFRFSSYHRGSLGESCRMPIGLIGGVPLLYGKSIE